MQIGGLEEGVARLSQLLHSEPSGAVLAGAAATAFGLGAVHALAPGHGKALVAAYLVGTNGTTKHAMLLGASVTFAHTICVFLLGLAALFLTSTFAPESLTPVLELIAGFAIMTIGGRLFVKRLMNLRLHCKQGHHHHHHGQPHHMPVGDISMKSMVALGASGGLAPCPGAMVLLLSAVSLGRTAFGLWMLIAFSAGLTIVLAAVGLMALYGGNLLPKASAERYSRYMRYVPLLSAAVITVVGLVMTVTAVWV